VMMIPLLLLLQASPQEAPSVAAQPTAPAYHGYLGELVVDVPRCGGQLLIDGVLDEEWWSGAALLTGFSQYSPNDGRPADDATEVLVCHTADAIYFGIRAFEPHGTVVARLSDRDRIRNDDHVQILLDTFRDARRAYAFGVNALGVQADGVRTEAQSGGRQGLMSTRAADPVDLSPDFVFESKGRITDYGYEVEVRIPFQSIRLPNRDSQQWGIQVIRHVQHSGQEQTWAPALRGRASFLAQSGTLRGMEGIHGRRVLDITPVATAHVDGVPGAAGAAAGEAWRYASPAPELGLNMRWGVTPNLTLNATANPDFSQVEADAGQLALDPRRAVFFPEKRPFFLEGSERFEAPNRLIYTRRVASPDAAVKLAGKLARWDVGLLSAMDGRAASAAGERALAHVARVQRDVGEQSTVGFLYSHRRETGFSNQVLAADTRVNFGQVYALAAQLAGSSTTAGGESTRGGLWDVSLRRTGRELGLDLGVQVIDPSLVASNGFLSRVNSVQTRFSLNRTRYGEPGARLESLTRGFTVSGSWLREDFFGPDRHIEDWKLHLNGNATVRGGWRIGASVLTERFFFPPYLYADYAIERRTQSGTDTVPFTGTPWINNYDLVVRLATPRSPRLSGSMLWIAGRDENFDEWAPAFIHIVNGSLEWRPDEQLRIEPGYILQHYIRPDDLSTVALRSVPRLRLEYQATRAIFMRVMGQYDVRYRDALRDDSRTGDPLLIRDRRTGGYVRAGQIRSNALRADCLFAYQPGPGTVIFAGYGSTLTEPRAMRFRDVERTSDRFFVKLSYLFRM
jgi:hypothetical protein